MCVFVWEWCVGGIGSEKILANSQGRWENLDVVSGTETCSISVFNLPVSRQRLYRSMFHFANQLQTKTVVVPGSPQV